MKKLGSQIEKSIGEKFGISSEMAFYVSQNTTEKQLNDALASAEIIKNLPMKEHAKVKMITSWEVFE